MRHSLSRSLRDPSLQPVRLWSLLVTKKNCVSRRSQPAQSPSIGFRSIPQKHYSAGRLASGRFRALLSKSGGIKKQDQARIDMNLVLQSVVCPAEHAPGPAGRPGTWSCVSLLR